MLIPEYINCYIAGELTRGSDEMDVINPSTEARVTTVLCASNHDIDAALQSSADAFGRWRSKLASERAEILRNAAAILASRAEYVATLLTLEQGKPLAQARLEVQQTVEVLEFYAAEGMRAYGRIIPSRVTGTRQMVLPEPIGPVAAFTPWNFPLLLTARKIAPALAAGCTCVVKPAEETPAAVAALGAAFHEAKLPPGALNILYGDPANIAERLIASPVIRKVSFTGSVVIGKAVAAQAARYLKPCTLELGGHAPVIVLDDVDVSTTAAVCAAAKVWNAGQVCTSPTRFYVQERIFSDFRDRFARELTRRPIGDGLDPKTRVGPLSNARRLTAVQEMVADAERHGASLVVGGKRIGEKGFFFQPTLICGLVPEAMAMTQEPFGPIAILEPFTELEQALQHSNRSSVGLAGYAFTRSQAAAVEISARLEVGAVAINSFAVAGSDVPFGGVKDSGYGYEGGTEGLAGYLHQKFVSHA